MSTGKPKVLGVNDILNKKYKVMENVPQWLIVGAEGHIVESRGRLGPTTPFALWPEQFPLTKKLNIPTLFDL